MPTLGTLDASPCHTDKYATTLTDLHTEFNRRFSNFAKIENELKLVSLPLLFDSEKAPPDVQLELINIQCDPALKEKFTSCTLENFYGSLKETQFPNLRRHTEDACFVWIHLCVRTNFFCDELQQVPLQIQTDR